MILFRRLTTTVVMAPLNVMKDVVDPTPTAAMASLTVLIRLMKPTALIQVDISKMSVLNGYMHFEHIVLSMYFIRSDLLSFGIHMQQQTLHFGWMALR